MDTTDIKRSEKISRVISGLTQPLHIIITQVDPDAIGSAFALMHIIVSKKKASQIFYCGNIGHPQNRCVVNKYNLNAIMKSIQTRNAPDNTPVAIIDSSTADDARLGNLRGKISPLIVIDHHRGSEIQETDNTFVHVEDMGACCTLMIELMNEMGFKFNELNERLPLLLALGIYTDTKALVSASERDREAYSMVTKMFSPSEMAELIRYSLPESHFKHLKVALENMQRAGSRLVTGVGGISAENGDDLSSIADWLIRMDGISLAAVWGRIGEQVRMSVRNRDLTTPLDEFLKKRFGENAGAKLSPDGIGEGGGLITLELGFLFSEDTAKEIDFIVNKSLARIFFNET